MSRSLCDVGCTQQRHACAMAPWQGRACDSSGLVKSLLVTYITKHGRSHSLFRTTLVNVFFKSRNHMTSRTYVFLLRMLRIFEEDSERVIETGLRNQHLSNNSASLCLSLKKLGCSTPDTSFPAWEGDDEINKLRLNALQFHSWACCSFGFAISGFRQTILFSWYSAEVRYDVAYDSTLRSTHYAVFACLVPVTRVVDIELQQEPTQTHIANIFESRNQEKNVALTEDQIRLTGSFGAALLRRR